MANDAKIRAAVKKFLAAMQVHDEDIPEKLADEALEMTEEVNDALCEVETEDEEANPLEITKDSEKSDDIDKKVADGVMKALRELGFYRDPAMKALDELEIKETEDADPDEEIKVVEDADNEEVVTVDPEKMKDANTLLRVVKPVIAQIKDSKKRKNASDALARLIRGSVRNTTSDYGTLMSAKKNHVAKDSKKVNDADYDFGMEIAKKFNPHYKEVK